MAIPKTHRVYADVQRMEDAQVQWVPIAYKILAGTEKGAPYKLGHFRTLAETKISDQRLHAAMIFLSSCSSPIFNAKIYVLGADGSRIDLSPGDTDKAIKGEAFPHPESGELIDEPASESYIAYDIRDDAFDIKATSDELPYSFV